MSWTVGWWNNGAQERTILGAGQTVGRAQPFIRTLKRPLARAYAFLDRAGVHSARSPRFAQIINRSPGLKPWIWPGISVRSLVSPRLCASHAKNALTHSRMRPAASQREIKRAPGSGTLGKLVAWSTCAPSYVQATTMYRCLIVGFPPTTSERWLVQARCNGQARCNTSEDAVCTIASIVSQSIKMHLSYWSFNHHYAPKT